MFVRRIAILTKDMLHQLMKKWQCPNQCKPDLIHDSGIAANMRPHTAVRPSIIPIFAATSTHELSSVPPRQACPTDYPDIYGRPSQIVPCRVGCSAELCSNVRGRPSVSGVPPTTPALREPAAGRNVHPEDVRVSAIVQLGMRPGIPDQRPAVQQPKVNVC